MNRFLFIICLVCCFWLLGCVNHGSLDVNSEDKESDKIDEPSSIFNIVDDNYECQSEQSEKEDEISDFDDVLKSIEEDSQYGYVMDGVDTAEYGYYDINGDEVDELIISTNREIIIFMYQNGAIRDVGRISYSVLLENGEIWYHRPGGAPMNDCYQCFYFDETEYKLKYVFERYDGNEDGIYNESEEGDLYIFYDYYESEGIEQELSKSEWEELIQPYLESEKAVLRNIGTIERQLDY